MLIISSLGGTTLANPCRASTYLPADKELSVPSWVHWNEKIAGKFTETLLFADATYYPFTGPRYPLGVLGIKTREGERLSLEQETLLKNFLSQISSALEREFLNDLAKQSISVAESERLYTTLFDSISHEMRTPITALIAASESLESDTLEIRPGIRRELAGEIQSAAVRLDNIVQNLLAMTRLESGLIQPKRDWTDLRDVFNSAIGKLGKELAEHTLIMDITQDLPLLKLDFALMEQVILNLLRNAATHTPAGSTIAVRVVFEGTDCVITVSDNGPGFPPDSMGKVFEKFYRVPGSKTGGLGLGLSIVHGFVRAHGGSIKVSNNPRGGARCVIHLPPDGDTHPHPEQK